MSTKTRSRSSSRLKHKMFRSQFSESHPFVLAIFGCQYHDEEPDSSKSALIARFQQLLAQSRAKHVETLESDDIIKDRGSSRIWISYWHSPQQYELWWQSPNVASFWRNLPNTAGFWREKLQFTAKNSMFESNHAQPNGFSHVGSFAPLVDKTGYWGAYRDRLDPDDSLASPLQSIPTTTSSHGTKIRPGRVTLDTFPDNICFVVEGQDFGSMHGKELQYWCENFDELTNEWVTICLEADLLDGILSSRICHDPTSAIIPSTTSRCWARGLKHNRRFQMFYFQDLSFMERLGKKYQAHRDLRKAFSQAYGPDGPMFGGDLLLWVDMGVLKAGDIEAEYVGCYEGTGFMGFAGYEAFGGGVEGVKSRL
ncbi:hypothetical protein AC579_8639 [Pseudocercospora musae]|uniref:Phenylacetaldoxime dehydratase n=1 Tax=Pseudocercospora musae TaxID=113226 RepID=A0A139IFE6_9PEZI|nr:hypothetical protein AC579_8639 [Pseudocercospora musae]